MKKLSMRRVGSPAVRRPSCRSIAAKRISVTDVYADIASKQRVVRKPWQDLMASIHGFAATIPSRNLSSPLLKPLPVPVPHEGTEREPLLGKKSPGGSLRHQPSMSERKDLKEIKKQRLVEKAIKDGVFPGGLAGELIAGTLKRKEIKKIIRRRTEPILSPTREDAEEGVIDEGEGGQNL